VVRHDAEILAQVTGEVVRLEAGDINSKQMIMLRELQRRAGPKLLYQRVRKNLRKTYRLALVKRSLLLRIAAAWVITVPLAALMGAMLFFTIRGMILSSGPTKTEPPG